MERVEEEAMQGLAQIMNQLYAILEPVVITWTVQLGLVDIINSHGRALTLSELASALPFASVHEGRLYRILRCMVHMRLFTVDTAVDGQRLYGLTPASQFLSKDGEKSIAPVVLGLTHDLLFSPLFYVPTCLDGEAEAATPFEMKHGKSIWEMVSDKPELNLLFNDFMSSLTRSEMPAVVKDGGAAFQGIASLVDVGGGRGMATSFIALAFPHIRCSVLDLPPVVATAPENPNLTFIPGNMFVSIPTADAIFIKNILHDWDDENCIRILQRCKEAIATEGGKVIIVDIVMDVGIDDPFNRARLVMDMEMMAIAGGKERNAEEWRKLLETAGFKILKITHTSSPQSIIEACPI